MPTIRKDEIEIIYSSDLVKWGRLKNIPGEVYYYILYTEYELGDEYFEIWESGKMDIHHIRESLERFKTGRPGTGFGFEWEAMIKDWEILQGYKNE